MGTRLKRIFLFCFPFILLNSTQIAHLNIDSNSKVFAAVFSSKDVIPRELTSGHSAIPLPGKGSGQYLDNSTKNALPRYGAAIRRNAKAYGIDWRLILAIMKQESYFNNDAISERGAYGLMQVMPRTGLEIANELGFDDLYQPHKNITGGTFYLAKLYDLFEGAPPEDRLKLALASYNAGPGRIYDAQEVAAYLSENPYSWQVIQKALPLLSKRYYTLHKSVWPARPQSGWDGGKPRNGYFGKSRQTILYVEKVVENYERYKSLLN